MTVTDAVYTAQATLTVVSNGISIFLTPPLVWFVALALGTAGIKIASHLITRDTKKSRRNKNHSDIMDQMKKDGIL
jgi:hypothetical protein